MSVAKNTYELTYIINAVISDDHIKNLVKRVSAYISESGGEILDMEEWGSRRLAYPIQKKRNGYYVNLYFRAAGSMISRLERALEIDDNILRYLTLRMDAKMIRHYESKKSVIPEGFDKDKDQPSDRSNARATPVPVATPKKPAKDLETDPAKPEGVLENVSEDVEEKTEETPDVVEQQSESRSDETAEQVVADAEKTSEASGEEDLPVEGAESGAASGETEEGQPEEAGEEPDVPSEPGEESEKAEA